MAFSFDTNLIIGLLNEQDRLHEKSSKVFETLRSENDETFVCLRTVVHETEQKLRKALNESIIKLLPVIPELIEISDPNSTKFQSKFLGKINELKEKDPYRASFYDLVYKKTMEFLKEGGELKYLNNFFSELVVDLSKSIDLELEEMAPNRKYFVLEEEDRKEIMRIVEVLAREQIEFKDSVDGEIFYRLLLGFGSLSLPNLTFISDDEGFIDTAKKAKSVVLTSLDYNLSELSFTTLEEIEEELELGK